jgi:hypothetical protein
MSFLETMSSRTTLLSAKLTPGALLLRTHELCHDQISGRSWEEIP